MNPKITGPIKDRVFGFLHWAHGNLGDESFFSVTQIAHGLGVSKSSVQRAIRVLGDRLEKYQVETNMEEQGAYLGRPPMVYAIKEDENGEN